MYKVNIIYGHLDFTIEKIMERFLFKNHYPTSFTTTVFDKYSTVEKALNSVMVESYISGVLQDL